MNQIFLFANTSHAVSVKRDGDTASLDIDGTPVHVTNIVTHPPRISFTLRDRQLTADVVQSGNVRWVHVSGSTLALTIPLKTGRTRAHDDSGGIGSGTLLAPMPGQVRAVLVAEGDAVAEGQPLLILEAMKMELQVRAPREGIVSGITVVVGARVERDQILGEIKEGK